MNTEQRRKFYGFEHLLPILREELRDLSVRFEFAKNADVPRHFLGYATQFYDGTCAVIAVAPGNAELLSHIDLGVGPDAALMETLDRIACQQYDWYEDYLTEYAVETPEEMKLYRALRFNIRKAVNAD